MSGFSNTRAVRGILRERARIGSLHNALARMAAAAIFRYDYRRAYAGEGVNTGGLAAWLLLWLVVDVAAYDFFEGFSWWWLLGGPVSVIGACLLLPAAIVLALAGLWTLRSALSLAVGCLGYVGAPLSPLASVVLLLQVWSLVAGVWLLLAYLRTPKRELSWRKENPQA